MQRNEIVLGNKAKKDKALIHAPKWVNQCERNQKKILFVVGVRLYDIPEKTKLYG